MGGGREGSGGVWSEDGEREQQHEQSDAGVKEGGRFGRERKQPSRAPRSAGPASPGARPEETEGKGKDSACSGERSGCQRVDVGLHVSDSRGAFGWTGCGDAEQRHARGMPRARTGAGSVRAEPVFLALSYVHTGLLHVKTKMVRHLGWLFSSFPLLNLL